MKEVTYEEWQKNPTPRMMWVCIKCGHIMEHDYLNVGWVCPYCGHKE